MEEDAEAPQATTPTTTVMATNEPVVRPSGGVGSMLITFIKVYWRAIFTIIWPLIILPIFLLDNTPKFRCMYVVCLMAGYWVTEAIPLPVTSIIPMVLFPCMGILDTERTCMCYLKDTNMMFMGGVMIAVAIEHSNLHNRIAMFVILLVGCSPRRLHLGLSMMTMLISMWISNTAATAMMCPIITAVLKELESQGLGEMYVQRKRTAREEKEDQPRRIEDEQPYPSKTTMAYFLCISYASSIGGIGSIVGTGSNLTFKGIYESRFPNAPSVNFAIWLIYNVPSVFIYMAGTWIWIQFLYMGLWRPNSPEAKLVALGNERADVARNVIKEKYDNLGKISWHELSVGILFMISLILWFFRDPRFVTGWAEMLTDTKVKDATPAVLVVILMFLIPCNLEFLKCFNPDASKRPLKASSGLLTWKVLQEKVPWGLIFLLGGGFALAEGSAKSGMSRFMGESLKGLATLNPIIIMISVCIIATSLTEIGANVAICNIILPVLMEMSIAIKLHPMYLMIPATINCSFAFMLPVGTPSNAMVAGAGNIPSTEMMKAGFGANVWTLTTCILLWITYGYVMYPLSEFPEWAQIEYNLTQIAS